MCYRKKRIRNRVLEEHRSGFDKAFIKAPCNNCPSCRKVRSSDWLVRSYFEFLNNHRQAYFCSLDFDNEHLPTYKGIPCFDSDIMKKFLKRLRNTIGTFRYFYGTDYGGFLKRPHYHLVCIPDNYISLSDFFSAVKKTWQQGHYTDVESIDGVGNDKLKAVSYVVSYATKDITFDPDKELSDMPPRFRPRVQASKGFGLQALEEGLITSDMILKDQKIALPIGKNGTLKSFPIPRYYELKLSYDYHWHADKYRAELTKNDFGVKLAKERHNRYYVYYIRQFFASRNSPVYQFVDSDFKSVNDWRSAVYSCCEHLDDFAEFVYTRPFIDYSSSNGLDHHDTIINDWRHRPSWAYYERCCRVFDAYQHYFEQVKLQTDNERLINLAKVKALKRLSERPYLVKYISRRNPHVLQTLFIKL